MDRRLYRGGLGAALLAGAWIGGATIAASDAGYAGSDACLGCHEEAARSLIHRGADAQEPRCEGCHGPGKAHVDAGGGPSAIRRLDELEPFERSAACLVCHEKGGARNWRFGAHAAEEVSCSDCHAVHNAAGATEHLLAKARETELCLGCHKLQRVESLRSSHMPLREGKISCSDCHDPHGSTSDAMLRDPSLNDNCYRCHAEKRGPFLFEHPPVRESCLNCHDPHGSMHESLLRSKQPRLCQNCHISSRHPSEPRVSGSRFVFNRGCVNCHPQVHGSNHPSGVRQMR